MAVGMATSIVHVFVMSKKNHDIILVDDMIKMQIDQNINKVSKIEEVKEKK